MLTASMMIKETYFNTYHYGYMLFQEEREREAVRYFERSAKLIGSESTWHWPYLRLGQARYNLKEYAKAKTVLKQAEKLRPRHSDAIYYLCYCCDHLGQKQEAIDYCNRYLALNTGDSKRKAKIKRKLRALNNTATGSNSRQNNVMNKFLKSCGYGGKRNK